MIINNHFWSMDVTVKKLNREFKVGAGIPKPMRGKETEPYKEMARHYAYMENAIAVLSDMRTNSSYIYYGGFAETLGFKEEEEKSEKTDSIWEEKILKRIHPDDLRQKYMQELRFSRFTQQIPPHQRRDYFLVEKLRMRNASGHYCNAMHRLFHISLSETEGPLTLALCLYSPLTFDFAGNCLVVNSRNGQTVDLKKRDDGPLLSEREKQVLKLIGEGMRSKEIAESLSISIHTVSRHRQEILKELQVGSSIEAFRLAKEWGLI